MTNIMRGSLNNRLNEGKQFGDLHVGMGATEMLYSDRHAYTVQKIVSENRVIVTRDEVKRIDQNFASDCQDYEFVSVPLVEGKREKMCRHPYRLLMENGCGSCKRLDSGLTCEGCEFYKFHKPTNGITLIKTKGGWKMQGGSSYFALGIREEHYDYSF